MFVLLAFLHVGEDVANALGELCGNRIAVGKIHVVKVHLGEGEDFFEEALRCSVAVMIDKVPGFG